MIDIFWREANKQLPPRYWTRATLWDSQCRSLFKRASKSWLATEKYIVKDKNITHLQIYWEAKHKYLLVLGRGLACGIVNGDISPTGLRRDVWLHNMHWFRKIMSRSLYETEEKKITSLWWGEDWHVGEHLLGLYIQHRLQCLVSLF